ncbi:hypothetical protein [Neobacillus sp. D3-1R]|uniref:hypothetical protein n=1 Tax=Neobacillus sp. D3-1R TaxID=3445778 RepID=UPI003FA1695B
MANHFWYGLITLISIIIFIITFHKTHDKKVIPLYTFLSGITYLLEYVILVLFKSYEYHPHLLKNNYYDGLLGSIASNAFSVPMVGAFIGALNLSWKWILFIVGIFLITEKWFVHIHAYTQFWWGIIHTGIGLMICFFIAKRWYQELQGNISIPVRFITLLFTSLLIQASTAFVLVAFFDLYHYEIGWFKNDSRDHVAFATAYILFLALIFTSLVSFKIKWLWKIVAILFMLPLNWLLKETNILHMSENWTLWHFLIMRLAVLILLELFNHFLLDSADSRDFQTKKIDNMKQSP